MNYDIYAMSLTTLSTSNSSDSLTSLNVIHVKREKGSWYYLLSGANSVHNLSTFCCCYADSKMRGHFLFFSFQGCSTPGRDNITVTAPDNIEVGYNFGKPALYFQDAL